MEGDMVALDPEEQAMRMLIHSDEIFNARLNFWLIFESILFGVIGALWSITPDQSGSVIKVVISQMGMWMTIFWHRLLFRSWIWVDWYSSRLQSIHLKRNGLPLNKYDYESLGIFPYRYHWDFRHGMGMKKGIFILAFAFFIGWIAMNGISLNQLWASHYGNSPSLESTFTAIVLGLPMVLLYGFWLYVDYTRKLD